MTKNWSFAKITDILIFFKNEVSDRISKSLSQQNPLWKIWVIYEPVRHGEDVQRDLPEGSEGDSYTGQEDEQDQGEDQPQVAPKQGGWNEVGSE